MTRLTPEQYKNYRDEWEKLALRSEDKSISDGDYHWIRNKLSALDSIFKAHFEEINLSVEERVARVLTRWLNGKRQEPLPDWNALPLSVQTAYLEQAKEAIQEVRRNEKN